MERLNYKAKNIYSICIYLSMWMLAGIHSAVGTLQLDVSEAFSLTGAATGVPSSLISAFATAAFVMSLFTAGRFRKSKVLFSGLLSGGIALCLILAVNAYSLFLMLLCCVGLATGIMDALNSSVISELYPGSGRRMSLLHAFYGLSGMSMPFLFNAMLKAGSSWKTVYLTLGVLMLALAVFLYTVSQIYKNSIEAEPDISERISFKMVKEIAKVRELRPLIISMLLGGMYLNVMLVRTKGFIVLGHEGAKYSAWVVSVIYLGITLCRLLLTALNPNMRKILQRMMPLSAVALLLAILVKNPLAAMIMCFISVFCYAPGIPFSLTIAGQIYPERRFVVTIALMLSLLLGQTIISPVYGWAESVLGANSAMYTALVCVIGCWVCTLFVKSNDQQA
ncbi:MAG: MFS transporter [Clostridia bacterium]|nr:MFS transporter [Clostridia bacterium]